jgi:tetratricopeptide (TPR) repeat protein
MEILKKAIIGLIFCLALCQQSVAQTALQKAFEKSYTLEAAAKYTEAITALKAVYDENNYETNLRLGWLCYMASDSKTALTYYKKATELLPMSIEAKFGYIYPLSILNNWDEVLAQYKSILKIEPHNSKANYAMALIYYYRKDYSTAKTYLDAAINLYPFDYDIVSLTAWNYFMLGKTEQAKVLFNKVLLLKPNDASALEGLKKLN